MFPHAITFDSQPEGVGSQHQHAKGGFFFSSAHRDRWLPDIMGEKRGELISAESDVTSLR